MTTTRSAETDAQRYRCCAAHLELAEPAGFVLATALALPPR